MEKKRHQHCVAELEDMLVELRTEHAAQGDAHTEMIHDLRQEHEAAQKKLRKNQQFLEVCGENFV